MPDGDQVHGSSIGRAGGTACLRGEEAPRPAGNQRQNTATDARGPERGMVCVGSVGLPPLCGVPPTPPGRRKAPTRTPPPQSRYYGLPQDHLLRRAYIASGGPHPARPPPRPVLNGDRRVQRGTLCHRSSSGAGCQPAQRDGAARVRRNPRGAPPRSIAAGRHERVRWLSCAPTRAGRRNRGPGWRCWSPASSRRAARPPPRRRTPPCRTPTGASSGSCSAGRATRSPSTGCGTGPAPRATSTPS